MPSRSARPAASGGPLLALFVVLAVFLAACAGTATSCPGATSSWPDVRMSPLDTLARSHGSPSAATKP